MVSIPAALYTAAISQSMPTPPWFNDGVQLSAFGVLAWALWYLLAKEMPRSRDNFRKTLDTISERQERNQNEWRQQLHADSEKLNDTLRAMTETCSRTRSEISANLAAQSGIHRRGDDPENIHG
jgi:hypothetical protein